jgi:hypothetical protein
LGYSSGGGSLTVSWPSWASDWLLWATTNLTPPSIWSRVTNASQPADGQLQVVLPTSDHARFFRLSSP